jgi:rSAM/selenodomain-associated transferase 1
MAKVPGATPVKSRLHTALTPGTATALYRCFLLDRLDGVVGLEGVVPVLAFTPAEALPAAVALAPPDFRLVAQRGTGLGARLIALFDELLEKGYGAVVVMDSDSPTLPVSYVAEAVTTLETEKADVVLGPTEDGGYYLIGLRSSAPPLFEDVPWSTQKVLDVTLDRARRLGLRVHLLPQWFDVDTEVDLGRLRRSLSTDTTNAVRTRAFLNDLPA